MKKYLKTISIFTLIISATLFTKNLDAHSIPEFAISEREIIANKITLQTTQELEKKYNLIPVGTGGSMMDNIKMMALSFRYFGEINIDTSRELIVKAIEHYLKNINANTEIKTYLNNYPFTPGNIELRLFLTRPNYQDFPPEQLDCITAWDGNIEYKTHNKNKKITSLHNETYEEAVVILKNQGKL